MNKRFHPEINPVLSDAIDNIETTLKCPKFLDYGHLIDIDTWENIKAKMPHNKKIAEKGFGFCITNYYEIGDFKRIIIVNMENCNRTNLTEREITAIIFHELGHLLNSPELVEEPTLEIMGYCMLNGINYKEYSEELRENNSIQVEVFADAYANQHGYGGEIISTFEKQNRHFGQKIGYFDERVEKINSKELFNGIVKPIDRNGW